MWAFNWLLFLLLSSVPLMMMYVSFQLTSLLASQDCEDLIPLLFSGFFMQQITVCVRTNINLTYSTIFTCFWEMIVSPASKIELLLLCSFPSTIYIFLFKSIILPYPVIVFADSTFSVFLVFFVICIWMKQLLPAFFWQDTLTFWKPWIVSAGAIWNFASSIMNARIVSTVSFLLCLWTQRLYVFNILSVIFCYRF